MARHNDTLMGCGKTDDSPGFQFCKSNQNRHPTWMVWSLINGFVLSDYLIFWLMVKSTHQNAHRHYSDDIMSAMAPPITSLTIVYSAVYSGADQRKHQSSASLVFVRAIHRWLVNSPHKGPVTRKMFPNDDVIMIQPVYKTHPTVAVLSLTTPVAPFTNMD